MKITLYQILKSDLKEIQSIDLSKIFQQQHYILLR